MTKPYDYQIEGVNAIADFDGRCLVADEMGLGKSLESLLYADLNNKARPMIVVCPAFLKHNWEDECSRHIHKRAEVIEGTKVPRLRGAIKPPPIIIINYDILKHWVQFLLRCDPQLVVIDECFLHNTLVETDKGSIEIGKIVEEQLPVKVKSFNHNTQKVEYHRVIRYIKKQRDSRIVSIKHSHGTLVCTENHEIWIEDKQTYVKAKNITAGQSLRMVQPTTNKSTESILRQKLLCKVESEPTLVVQSSEIHIQESQPKNQYCKNRCPATRCLNTNDTTQSRIRSQSLTENTKDKTEKRHLQHLARKPWRERNTHNTTNQITQSTWTEMDNGIVYPNALQSKERINLPIQLQSRYRTQKVQNCNRGRWWNAQKKIDPSKRQKENQTTEFSRVESVTIHKPTSGSESKICSEDNQKVYCLEVEHHHNFFADGILVHNCQYIKNWKAQRTKATKKLCRHVPHVVALGGTPIDKEPAEFWEILHLICPDVFESRRHFLFRYCGPKKNYFGWEFKGASNIPELRRLLRKHCMIRRLKKDVLHELPKKRRVLVPIPIIKRREYEAASKDLIKWLRKLSPGKALRAKKAKAMVRTGYLLRLVADLKMKAVIEWVDNFLTNSKGKLIIVAIHKKIIAQLQEHYKGQCVAVHGKIKGKKRHLAIKQFQNDKQTRVCIAQLSVTIGWNATAADSIAFIEHGYLPTKDEQAIDRIHRIGQTKKCTAYFLYAEDTIEERLCKIKRGRMKTINAILDGGDVGEDYSAFDQLIRELRQKDKQKRKAA